MSWHGGGEWGGRLIEDMAGQLRALAALSKDSSLILSILMATENCLTPVQGEMMASSSLHKQHTCAAQAYM